MEDHPRVNLFEKAKSFFYQIRWLFCLFNRDENLDKNGKQKEKVVDIEPNYGFAVNKEPKKLIKSKCIEDYKRKCFNDLPSDCVWKIFFYLSIEEKVKLRGVCRKWYDLIHSGTLWRHINLSNLTNNKTENHIVLKKKIKGFSLFFKRIDVKIISLKFKFDFVEHDWHEVLLSFLRDLKMEGLREAKFKWDGPQSPQKTSTNETISDVLYRHRRRFTKFQLFFKTFVSLAPNVKKLSMPFEWTDSSLDLLCKLQKLKHLNLQQSLHKNSILLPGQLSYLLESLPNLTYLDISTSHCPLLITSPWSLSSSLSFFNFSTSSLPHFENINLPNCHTFNLICRKNKNNVDIYSNHNSRGGRNYAEEEDGGASNRDISQLIKLLSKGAPNLRVFNHTPLSFPLSSLSQDQKLLLFKKL